MISPPCFIPSSYQRQHTPIQLEKNQVPFQTEFNKYGHYSNGSGFGGPQSQQILKNPIIQQEISSYLYNQNHQALLYKQNGEKELGDDSINFSTQFIHHPHQINDNFISSSSLQDNSYQNQCRQHIFTPEGITPIQNHQIQIPIQSSLVQFESVMNKPTIDLQEKQKASLLIQKQKENSVLGPYLIQQDPKMTFFLSQVQSQADLMNKLKKDAEQDQIQKVKLNLVKEMTHTRDLQRKLNYQFRYLDQLFENYDLALNGTGDQEALNNINQQIQQNIIIISNIQAEIHSSQSRRFSILKRNYYSSKNLENLLDNQNRKKEEGIFHQEENIPFQFQTLSKNCDKLMGSSQIESMISNNINSSYSQQFPPVEKTANISQQSCDEIVQSVSSDQILHQLPLNTQRVESLLNSKDTKQNNSDSRLQNNAEEKGKFEELKTISQTFLECVKTEKLIEESVILIQKVKKCSNNEIQQNPLKKKTPKKQNPSRNVVQNLFNLLIKYLLSLEMEEGAAFREYMRQYSKVTNKNIKLSRSILRNYPLINEIGQISNSILREDLELLLSFQRGKLPLIQQIQKINYYNSLIRTYSTQFIVLLLPQIIQQNQYYIQKESIQSFAQSLLSYIQNPNNFLRVKC